MPNWRERIKRIVESLIVAFTVAALMAVAVMLWGFFRGLRGPALDQLLGAVVGITLVLLVSVVVRRLRGTVGRQQLMFAAFALGIGLGSYGTFHAIARRYKNRVEERQKRFDTCEAQKADIEKAAAKAAAEAFAPAAKCNAQQAGKDLYLLSLEMVAPICTVRHVAGKLVSKETAGSGPFRILATADGVIYSMEFQKADEKTAVVKQNDVEADCIIEAITNNKIWMDNCKINPMLSTPTLTPSASPSMTSMVTPTPKHRK